MKQLPDGGRVTSRKELFIKNSIVNIKQYNASHEDTPLSKMLIVVDEYANLLNRAEAEYAEVDGKKVKLSTEIERLCVKIAQEHISRGATLMIITQNFAKNALGKVYDAMGAKMVGYAPSNVASSLEIITDLRSKRVNLELGDIGRIEDSQVGNLIFTIFSTIAEMECSRIVERTQEGKTYQREHNPNFREGRPRKLSEYQIKTLIERTNYESITQLARSYNVSRNTIYRYINLYKNDNLK